MRSFSSLLIVNSRVTWQNPFIIPPPKHLEHLLMAKRGGEGGRGSSLLETKAYSVWTAVMIKSRKWCLVSGLSCGLTACQHLQLHKGCLATFTCPLPSPLPKTIRAPFQWGIGGLAAKKKISKKRLVYGEGSLFRNIMLRKLLLGWVIVAHLKRLSWKATKFNNLYYKLVF